MITEKDLNELISYYQGVKKPGENTCIKLASCLIILDHIEKQKKSGLDSSDESFVTYSGESEFAKSIRYKKSEKIWPIIDEAMSTLQLLQPQLYDTMMKKIHEV